MSASTSPVSSRPATPIDPQPAPFTFNFGGSEPSSPTAASSPVGSMRRLVASSVNSDDYFARAASAVAAESVLSLESSHAALQEQLH